MDIYIMTESENYVIKTGFLLRKFSIFTVVIIIIIIVIIILNGLASYLTLHEKKYLR
jgi:hypothetical protein